MSLSDSRPIPAPLKRAALGTVQAVGRASASRRVLPSFLIVGGQRCGTTSMYRALAAHPAVMTANLHKGVHYFDVGYTHDLDWYRAHFPLAATARRKEKRLGIRPQAFESSPYYMFHPAAPERIGRDLPGVRLVVLVRDPVERAHSAHAHEVARGFDDLGFEAAIEAEPQRLRGEVERLLADPGYVSNAHRHQAYLTRGQYVDALRVLEAVVGRERIHVVDSHRFFGEPDKTLAGVHEFLGLPQSGEQRIGKNNARPRPDMPDALYERLRDHFEPWDTELAEWLGWTPSWRL